MVLFLCFSLLRALSVDHAVALARSSDRVLLIGETDAERLGRVPHVPPGKAPVLSFRYIEGSKRHGFGDLDLMVDDAGH